MSYLWITIAIAAGLTSAAIAVLLRHRRQVAIAPRLAPATFPESGFLVPDTLLGGCNAPSASIVDVLASSTVPLGLEYRPAAQIDLTKYRAVPVNAAAQQALAKILKAIDPKGETLFKVVIPEGKELADAAGGGFRGFFRGEGGQVEGQAVLKPVGIGGRVLAAWPVLLVAGTVMAVDMWAQREQRAHQRLVEAILARQEQRAEDERIARQQTIDHLLSGAISRMLDGQPAELEGAKKSALEEFYRARLFLDRTTETLKRVVGQDGKADFRRLEQALGGGTKNVGAFLCDLHFALAALALTRKALIADAASAALADPENPYTALRRHFELSAEQLERAERLADQLTTDLRELELRGRWYDFRGRVADRQTEFREKLLSVQITAPEPVQYLAHPSGEIHQLVPE